MYRLRNYTVECSTTCSSIHWYHLSQWSLHFSPHRNTIDRQNIIKPNMRLLYDIPRPNPAIVKLVAGDNDHDYVDPASDSENEDESYYKVPMPSRLLGETKVNGITSAPVKSREDRSRSDSGSPPRQQGPIQATSTTLFERQSSDRFSQSPPSVPVWGDEEHIYEMEPTPTIPIYENTQVAIQKNSSHPLPPLPRPNAGSSNIYQDDYVDLDAHDTYVNPSELQSAESMDSMDVPVTPITPSTPSEPCCYSNGVWCVWLALLHFSPHTHPCTLW